MKNEIITIIVEAFENNITSEGWSDYGTPMADVLGKDDFLKEVEDKLIKLLSEPIKVLTN